ncbi:predicted protein [Plenodomus lingam JN3]|uniref:Predicted protein n=1 Tax=Leptosphaeria maculans (strain JN3 / isolate v23.1.3 / race Av1-4-5-6-7-8) TaxID=985895 RepID=E5A4U1_LEPMJ|nr:predicted protein [Plenodomus lingam JN3]CBX98639.1 predicted protein [Plenodomus lingam JN3]
MDIIFTTPGLGWIRKFVTCLSCNIRKSDGQFSPSSTPWNRTDTGSILRCLGSGLCIIVPTANNILGNSEFRSQLFSLFLIIPPP